MLHNEDLLISNHNLKITKKEHYFLCESSSGKSLKFGNFSDKTYIFEKKENNCKEYEWEEKTSFYIMSDSALGRKYKKYKLLYNPNNSKIYFFEEMLTSDFGGFGSVFKETIYDSSLFMIGVNILNTPINTNFKYDVFVTKTYKTVLHQKTESILVITIYDLNNGKFLSYTIPSVKDWYILSKNCNHNKVFYPYLILKHTEGYITIWSLESSKSIKGSFKNIAPISFAFNKQHFSSKNAIFFDSYCTAICIDDNIYNDDFSIMAYKRLGNIENWKIFDVMKFGTLLDTCGQFVAYERGGIYILKVNHVDRLFYPISCIYEKKDDIPFLNLIEEVPFYDSMHIHFNIQTKRFVIDKDFIRKGTSRNSEFVDHCSLMDALDGDPEAYWNID